jgi:hypothetical protein
LVNKIIYFSQIEGLVKTLPHGYVTTPEYTKQAEEIYNFEPRPDDVFVLTFPKCGKNILKKIKVGIVNHP